MKVAASTCILPPQLGPELGLPTSQSTVSALQLYTRILGKSILSLSHTPSQPVQLWWPFRRKGWHLHRAQTRCCLQYTTGKRGPEKAVWERQIEKEHHLSGMGTVTFGTIEEI